MVYDPDKTPTATPNAKKSSGEWKLNLASARCARETCGHRRDEHRIDERRVARECDASGCPQFVIGGPDDAPDTERDP